MIPKTLIRKQALEARNAMSREDQRRKSCQISERFLDLEICQEAETIFLYAGFGSEVITRELCCTLLIAGKQIAMPRVDPDRNEMDFYQIPSYSRLTKGYGGILEPDDTCLPAGTPDIIVMPGTAFDRNRGRIGYGQGFYDRYLARISGASTVAFAFECQIVDEVPTEPHDFRPDILVTENAVYESACL